MLGANDGIVSVASIIFGVAGATSSQAAIVTAGVAGMVAGALSMATGEYVSVSTQLDTEKALIEKEKWELQNEAELELQELAEIYQKKGMSKDTAHKVALELTEHNALKVHLEAELGINQDELTNPVSAALASGASFVVGAIIPIIFIYFSREDMRMYLTFLSVIVALIITGVFSAHVGGANKTKATTRVVLGGVFAMLVTYFVGKVFGVTGL